MNVRPTIPAAEDLTPAEKVIDLGLWLENRDRYIEQSRQTKDNDRAEIPPRASAR